MLGNRHQLDVGISHLLDVRDELGGHLSIAQRGAILVTLPGGKMQFIDRERLFQLVIELRSLPVGVVPLILGMVIDHRGK